MESFFSVEILRAHRTLFYRQEKCFHDYGADSSAPAQPMPREARLQAKAGVPACFIWSGWPDSNRRPPRPKRGALAKLRYSPLRG
jgi:hypothetical protein